LIVAFADRYLQTLVDSTLANKLSNLRDDGFDVALGATDRLRDSSRVARKLGVHEMRLYASPGIDTPASLRELHAHRYVVFRAEDLAQTRGAGCGVLPVACGVRRRRRGGGRQAAAGGGGRRAAGGRRQAAGGRRRAAGVRHPP